MKQTLTESQLRAIIAESISNVLKETENIDAEMMEENVEDESWLGDKWNQARTAANTFTQRNGDMGIKDRFSAAKKNWNSQGELNGLKTLQDLLTQFLDNGQVSPQTTVAQLVGGKYNNNKFGTLTGKVGNRQAQIARRGGKFN